MGDLFKNTDPDKAAIEAFEMIEGAIKYYGGLVARGDQFAANCARDAMREIRTVQNVYMDTFNIILRPM